MTSRNVLRRAAARGAEGMTLVELEQILVGARAVGAGDDTLVEVRTTWRGRLEAVIIPLPHLDRAMSEIQVLDEMLGSSEPDPRPYE
jgi:hypothetical protein